jgi:hypothetical protein
MSLFDICLMAQTLEDHPTLPDHLHNVRTAGIFKDLASSMMVFNLRVERMHTLNFIKDNTPADPADIMQSPMEKHKNTMKALNDKLARISAERSTAWFDFEHSPLFNHSQVGEVDYTGVTMVSTDGNIQRTKTNLTFVYNVAMLGDGSVASAIQVGDDPQFLMECICRQIDFIDSLAETALFNGNPTLVFPVLLPISQDVVREISCGVAHWRTEWANVLSLRALLLQALSTHKRKLSAVDVDVDVGDVDAA